MSGCKTVFLIHIEDGYSFRNLISMYKSQTTTLTMSITKDLIDIRFIGSGGCILNVSKMKTSEITKFTWSGYNQFGEQTDKIFVSFNTVEMFNAAKSLGKKDAILMYMTLNSDLLNIQPIKSRTKDPNNSGVFFIKTIELEEQCIPTNDDVYPERPNVKVQSKDFHDLCGQTATSKCSSLEMICCAEKVIFHGKKPNGSLAFYYVVSSSNSDNDGVDNSNGDIGIDDDEIITHISLPISVVKAISKIHSISPTGSHVKFYFSRNYPVKLETIIGVYGVFSIYAIDKTQQNTEQS